MQKFLRTLMLMAAMLLPFASHAQTMYLTVADSTATSTYVPVYGLYMDDPLGCQSIYPAEMLTDMIGENILSLHYYVSSGASTNWGSNKPMLVKLMVVEESDLSGGYIDVTDATTVYDGTISAGDATVDNGFTIDFTAPFMYTGGNLLVSLQINPEDVGGYSAITWLGKILTNASRQGSGTTNYNFSGTGTIRSFLPKTTFMYGAAPTCFKVTAQAIDATQTTANSLTLTWTDALNNGATYRIYNMSDTTLVQSGITTTSYTVNNLDPNTNYTFGIMTDCGNGDVTNYAIVSGRTACAALTELPYTCSFEENEILGTANADAFPYCWVRINSLTSGSYSYYPYSSTSSAHEGNRKLYFYGSNYGTYADTTGFILPELDVTTYPMNGNRLSFWAKVTSTTDYNVIVGTMSDPTDMNTFTPVETVTVTGTTYTKYAVSLANADATNAYVAVIVPKVAATMWIDDVTLEEMPSCLEVPSVAITTSSSSATLTWAENPANASATYSIFMVNADGNTTLATGINDTAYTVEDLDANTQYTFAVQANCPSGDAPLTTVSGRTLCGAEAFPFTENFDASLTSDPCWGGNTALTAEQVFAGETLTLGANSAWTYASTASNGLEAGHYRVNIYGTSCKKWMVTPMIDLTQAEAPVLTFDAAFTKYSGTVAAEGFESNSSQAFMVLISTDGGTTWPAENAVMWMNEGGQHTLAELASTEYIKQMVDLSQYVGQTIRIAFYAQSTTSGGDNNLHIDNIAVRVAPNCMPVTGLTASDITLEGATLTWEGEAPLYNIYMIVDNEAVLYDSVADNAYTFAGLSASTPYTFGVTAYCGEEESDMVNVSFRTACGAFEVPYTWDFEDDATNAAPVCWTKEGAGSANVTSGTSNAHNSSNYLKFSGSQSNLIVLPQTAENINGLQLRFWTRPEGYSYANCGSFSVGYIGYDTTFVEVANYDRTEWSSNTYEQKFVFFTDAPEGARIAMRHNANATNYYWYVDDVTIDVAPECGEAEVNTEEVAACTNYTWEQNNHTYTTSGEYSRTLQAANGCDSVVYVLNLTINQGTNTVDSMTAVGSYEWYDTVYYESGVYTHTYTDGNGCQSMMTLYLTVEDAPIECPNGTCDFVIYAQDSYGDGWNGNTINVMQNDNVISYTLESGSSETATVTVCAGEPLSFSWTAGSYAYEASFTIVNANGDQLFQSSGSNLTSGEVFMELADCGSLPPIDTTFATACDSYEWNGTTYTTSGTYANGLNVLALTILESVHTDVEVTTEEPYTWNDTTYTASGDYTMTYPAANGCDSVVTLHLTVNLPCSGTFCQITIVGHDSYGDGWNGNAITVMQGDYEVGTFTLTSGSEYTATFGVCSDYPVNFFWTTGGYAYETSFEIYDGGNGMVYSGSDSQVSDSGAFFTLENSCPSCLAPTNLTVSDITVTGATLNWEGTADSYAVFNAEGVQIATVTTNSYDLTGLNANMNYTFGVASICTGETSSVVSITFNSPCAAVDLPYTETFDATSGTRNCWNLVATGNIGGSNGMGFVTVNDREVLRFSSYSNASDYNQYGFSPLMNVSATATNVGVQVTYATYNSNDKLWFGYVADNDTVWFEDEYTTGGNSDWQIANLVIPTTATQLAIHYYGNFAYYAWIDEVIITDADVDTVETFETACDSYTLNGQTYTESGVYTNYGADATGYHYYIHNVTINQSVNSTIEVTAEESYTWNGETYTESGVYTATFTAANECDSVVTLNLTIVPPAIVCPNGTCDIAIYAQDSYGDGWNGNTINVMQNNNTVASYTMASQGVSSTVIFDTATITVCTGEAISFSWIAGSWAQEVSFTIVNANGNTAYVVNNGSTLANGEVFFTMENCAAETVCETEYINDAIETCDSYSWHNNTYSESGIYTDSTVNAMGCLTEVATLTLTILGNSVTTDLYESATDSYTWNNETYTQSGNYDMTYPAANGCDSVVTLHLTIFQSGIEVPYSTGFEAGDDVAWTLANGPNGWMIGTADSSATSQTLYISNDGITNAYTITTPSYSYAYKAFNLQTIPYEVSYDWKANGESNYDFLRVFAVPSSEVIEGDVSSNISTTGAPAGWIALDGGSKLNLTTTWTSENHIFTPEEAGGYYIVFYWRNDNSMGNMPPASVDNFSIAPADTVCVTNYNAEEAQGCDNYSWHNNTYSESGVYTDMVYNELGCLTEVDTLYLTISYTVNTTISDTAVGSYTINDSTYTQSGSADVAFTAANGCDSIVTFHWVVLPNVTCEEGNVITVANADASTTTQKYMPAYSYYNYSYSEVIVPAERMVGIGTVKAMQFKPADVTNGSSYFTNCEVYMANTSMDNLTNGFIQDTDVLQLVWTGDMNFTTTDWQTLVFTNNFEWDGVSNVVVAVRRSHGEWATAPQFESYNAGTGMGRYVYTDNGAYTIGEITGGTASSTVPLYNFIGCEGNTTFCYPVQNLVANDVTSSSVTLSWEDNHNTGATYNVYQGESIMATVSGTSYTVNNLSPMTSYTFRVSTNCADNQMSNAASVNVTTAMYCETGYCTVGIIAADSYGDGWNGYAINVMMDSTVVDTYTLTSGYNGSTTVNVCAGQPISFSGVSGQYPSEVSFQITNAEGITVHSGVGADLTSGEVFFTMSSCAYMPEYDSVVYEASTCDSYYWELTGETYYTSGVYTFVANNTLYILNLSIYPCVVTITATTNDATLGIVYGGGVFNYGDTVTLMALPENGSQFNGWNISGSNPLVFAATESMTVTANFSVGGAIIHDTTTIVETVVETVTEYVTEYVHDTTTVVETDTVYVHDTTTVVETVTEYVHDTTTVVETVTEYVHDTTTVVETVTEYVHDTTTVVETVTEYVHDTVTVTETVVETVTDTVTNTEYIYDTTVVTETDTLYLTTTDTVYLTIHDTVYITVHDTIYITEQGIPGTESGTEVKIYSSHGQIVVEGADGNEVRLYDVVGRVLATKRDEYAPLRFDAPASGTYMIKIGNYPARRVVVIK